MTIESTLDDFLEVLRKSELIPADKFAHVVTELKLRELESPEAIGRSLIRNRVITPFQSERLLAGRARGFFIGSYKVLEILGVGGMGCIYIADNVKTSERVALKVLTTRHEVDSGMKARFVLEAKAGLKLNHENVCRTLEMGDTGAIIYLVMEFFKSVSLHEVIALSGKIAAEQACDLFMQAAKGLHHAHRKGLVHRDVKPANFLVNKDGELKVLDFGLALLRDDPDAEFSLQMIFGHDCLGTADFIAPEQTLNSSQVDPRADIYSLGCTMYLALTGKLPFPYQHTAQKLEAHRSKKAISIRELNPDVPPEVANIVEKMMRKRPEQRFADCLEVTQALAQHARRQPVKFDFQKILGMRIAETKLREKALQIGRTSTIAGASGRRHDSSRQRLQERIDTVVAKDTEPARKRAGDIGLKSSAELAAEQISNRWISNLPDEPTATRFLLVSGSGREMPLSGTRVVIGRDPTSTICIPNSRIAAQLCELRPTGDEWSIADLSGASGIRINGTDKRIHTLQPGDRIEFGENHCVLYGEYGGANRSPAKKWALLAGLAMILATVAGLIWKVVE